MTNLLKSQPTTPGRSASGTRRCADQQTDPRPRDDVAAIGQKSAASRATTGRAVTSETRKMTATTPSLTIGWKK